MSDEVRQFYQTLASNYHLIFADWRASVLRQSEVLDNLLRRYLDKPNPSVLDCSCGIGTQAIGLALRGYAVHATDLSADAVERARQEAAAFGVDIRFGVADFRELESTVPGQFDAVISFDNSIAHMQTEAELDQALRSMAAKVAPGGALLVSLRDYDQLAQEQPRSTLPVVKDQPEGRSIVFQVWDWNEDASGYHLNHFTVRQQGEAWETICAESHLRAWRRAQIIAALEKTGLTGIDWLLPEASGFYQPVAVARKPA